jgi:hypothetical protein
MKQAAFLAALALTGSVREAARRVGMTRETAYRLRRKPGGESFADAWDKVTGRSQAPARKVTPTGLRARAIGGLLKPLIYRGRHVAPVKKADNSALLRYDAQFARCERRPPGRTQGDRCFAPRSASTLSLSSSRRRPGTSTEDYAAKRRYSSALGTGLRRCNGSALCRG